MPFEKHLWLKINLLLILVEQVISSVNFVFTRRSFFLAFGWDVKNGNKQMFWTFFLLRIISQLGLSLEHLSIIKRCRLDIALATLSLIIGHQHPVYVTVVSRIICILIVCHVNEMLSKFHSKYFYTLFLLQTSSVYQYVFLLISVI